MKLEHEYVADIGCVTLDISVSEAVEFLEAFLDKSEKVKEKMPVMSDEEVDAMAEKILSMAMEMIEVGISDKPETHEEDCVGCDSCTVRYNCNNKQNPREGWADMFKNDPVEIPTLDQLIEKLNKPRGNHG